MEAQEIDAVLTKINKKMLITNERESGSNYEGRRRKKVHLRCHDHCPSSRVATPSPIIDESVKYQVRK